MEDVRIIAAMAETKPDYRPYAEYMMNRILAWYEDPEHEAEYQEWKKGREVAS